MTNVRISRQIRTAQGVLIKTEVLGEWIVGSSEGPDSTKMKYIQREIASAQEEEPELDWHMEFRGTETNWQRKGA